MNSFTFLLVCVQALLIQSTLSCPCAAPAPAYPCASPYPGPYPGSYHGSYPGEYHGIDYCGPVHEPYGLSVQGSSLKIDGTAQVWGDMPLASSVALDGSVPAEGTASLRNACCCGDAYLS